MINLKPLYNALNAVGDGKSAICDYVAGMKDEYATRMHERLLLLRKGQFSDSL